ncbi:MAG TPA: HNH endonuclease [Polyangiaceae bacterium]|nr:HNH endonuclease [Polyangiaceae bacterium]
MKAKTGGPSAGAAAPDPCPLCERPNYRPSDHHMVPKSRGGKATTTLCSDCHRAIHATFSNKQLEREYNTVDALLAHEEFRRMVQFIARQDGHVSIATRRDQRRRGRNG